MTWHENHWLHNALDASIEKFEILFLFSDLVFQDGWFRFGSKLLKSFSERKTWEEARQFCHSIDGELVSITHENENEFISHLLDRVKIDETGWQILKIHFKKYEYHSLEEWSSKKLNDW